MTNVQDAAAIAANTTSQPASNFDAMKTAYFDRCRQWGEKKGAGDSSKVGMILDTAKAAWDGIIVPSRISAGSDASKAYDGWRAGKQAKGVTRHSDDDKSRATRISEINKYVTVGALPLIHDTDMGGYSVLKRAEKIIRASTDIKGEVEDLLSKVATLQLRQPQAPLTDDEIVAACEPKTAKTETYVDAVGRIRQQFDSLLDKFPDKVDEYINDHKTARACTQSIIDAEGGTAAEIRKRELEAAKAAAKKAKASNKKKR
jgi:hypothetical protein